MKMKRFLSILAVVVVLCTFCAVAAMADDGPGDPPSDVTNSKTNPIVTSDPDHEPDESESWEITAKTCETAGLYIKKCTTCSITAGTSVYHYYTVKAEGHDWGEWESTTDPTCTTPGVLTATCKICGATKTSETALADHVYDVYVVDRDDCEVIRYHKECVCGKAETTQGQGGKEETKYYTTVLDTIYATGDYKNYDYSGELYMLVAQTTIDHYVTGADQVDGYKVALAHQWSDWNTTTEPTCCKTGLETRTCILCQAKEYKTINKLDHEWQVVSSVLDSDCQGITITRKCVNCTYNEQGAATCGCGEEAVDRQYIKGDFHNWTAVTENGEAVKLCYTVGSGEDTVYYASESEVPSGQTGTPYIIVGASCTKDGEKLVKCEYCESYKLEKEKALGHDYVYELIETFYKDGVAYGSYMGTCTRCGGTCELISKDDPNETTEPSTPDTPSTPSTGNNYVISVAGSDSKITDTSISIKGAVTAVDGSAATDIKYLRVTVALVDKDGNTRVDVDPCEIVNGQFTLNRTYSGYTITNIYLVALNDSVEYTSVPDPAWSSNAVSPVYVAYVAK